MKKIDLIMHFLNDAEFNEAFILDFEMRLQITKYEDSFEEKREALDRVKDELELIIRNLAKDHSNCLEFTGWITDYIIPEIRAKANLNRKNDFKLELVVTDIENGDDFEDELKTKIATILYQEFHIKNIFHLQVCQNCSKIYIPKRLDPKAKHCNDDCKHELWMKYHPDKKLEYKRKRSAK